MASSIRYVEQGIKPTADVTGKNTATAQAAKAPKTTTGDKLQSAVSKPATPTPKQNLQPGLEDQLTMNRINTEANVGEALRMYQNEAAKQQLQNSLATINRSAMQQYEGIANDYAARGMVRSGGYMRANDRALATTTQQKVDAETAVRDFINQNQLQGIAQTGMKQANLQDILVKLLSQFNANNIQQLGL